MGLKGVKRGKYKKLSVYHKNQVLLKAFKLYGNGVPITKIATRLSIPATSLYDWLSSDEHFAFIKKTQTQKIVAGFLDDIQNDRHSQAGLRFKASFGQLTTDIGVKWDKVHPQPSNLQQFNVGDKKVNINYPQWNKTDSVKDDVE